MEDTIRHGDQYRALFEQASDFIILVDFTGNIVDVNASLCNTFGYSKDELLQMNVSLLIEEENYQANPIKFSLLQHGVHIFSERKMVFKDGTIIEVEANVKK